MTRIQVAENLAFDAGCGCSTRADGAVAIVHACKDPCHRRAAGGYKGNLKADHPDYLALEKPHHLYLNLVDPPLPLFKRESFAVFFDFVDREIKERPVLIHCNQGQSRAPSLALLYMAKRLGLLPDESYAVARVAFAAQFPYEPGLGIATFLEREWAVIGSVP